VLAVRDMAERAQGIVGEIDTGPAPALTSKQRLGHNVAVVRFLTQSRQWTRLAPLSVRQLRPSALVKG